MNVTKLKAAIEHSSLTKKEIALKSGITPQSLYAVMNGSDPKVSTLEAIANVVGIKMCVLFEENGIEIKGNDHSFNSNADEIIKELAAVIKSQEMRIQQLTDRLLGL